MRHFLLVTQHKASNRLRKSELIHKNSKERRGKLQTFEYTFLQSVGIFQFIKKKLNIFKLKKGDVVSIWSLI